MPMYNLIEYSNNYSKKYWILWQYCRDEPALDANHAINHFTEANFITDSFKTEEKKVAKLATMAQKNVEIMVSLKYLSNFWRTLEMPLINSQINFDLSWSEKYVIVVTYIAS